MTEAVVGLLIYVVLVLPPVWRITARSGFPAALSLVTVIPVLGFLIWTVVMAFVPWPARSN